MKKFSVLASIELKVYVTVEAESESDALEKATELDSSEFLNGEVNDISTINMLNARELK
jgi:hypothetical protein